MLWDCAPFPAGYWVDPGHLEPRGLALGVLGQSGKGRTGLWAERAAVGKARAPVRSSTPAFKQTAIFSLASAHPHPPPHSPTHICQGCAGHWFSLWAWPQPQPTGQNPDPALPHPSPQGGAWCPGLAALFLAGRKGPGGSGEQVLFNSPEQCKCFLFFILNKWASSRETQAADRGKILSATAGAREVLPGRTHPALPYQIKGDNKKLEGGTPRCPMAFSTLPVSIDWGIWAYFIWWSLVKVDIQQQPVILGRESANSDKIKPCFLQW